MRDSQESSGGILGGMRAALFEQGGAEGRNSRALVPTQDRGLARRFGPEGSAFEGSADNRPSFLEKRFVDGLQGAGQTLKEGVGEAGKIIGAYLGTPGTAVLIKLLYRHFLDIDKDLEGRPWNRVERALRMIDQAGSDETRQQRRAILSGVLGRQFIGYFRQRQRDLGGGDLNEEERALAYQVARAMGNGQSVEEIRAQLSGSLEEEYLEKSLESAVSLLISLNQRELLERIRALGNGQMVILDIPPLPLILSALVTGRGFVKAVGASMIEHAGKRKGLQVVVKPREDGSATIVVLRGGIRGGANELAAGMEVDWDEPPKGQVLSDTPFGNFLRRILRIKEPVEFGILTMRAPGRSGEEAREQIPLAARGRKTLRNRGELGSVVRDRLRTAAGFLKTTGDLEESIARLLPDQEKVKTLKRLLARCLENVDEVEKRRRRQQLILFLSQIIEAAVLAKAPRTDRIMTEGKAIFEREGDRTLPSLPSVESIAEAGAMVESLFQEVDVVFTDSAPVAKQPKKILQGRHFGTEFFARGEG